MPRDSLKSGLIGLSGPGPYRAIHAAVFLGKLLLARLSPGFAAGFFGRDMLAFAGLLRPGNLVLDIGAFLGGSTALFADAVGPDGRIIAFEPVHHRFLGLTIRSLRLRRAKVEPIALAEKAGIAELVIPIRRGIPLYSQSGFAASYPEASAAGSGYAFQRLTARRMRLDDYLEASSIAPESVSAVKIDVEGSEMGLFAGGERFFGSFRGPVLCEFWFREMPPPGWVWLRERGYSCRYLGGDGEWLPIDTADALEEACRGETYGNFLMRRG